MAASVIPEILCAQVSELVAERTGLYFPPERHADLKRGLVGTANELGFPDTVAFVQRLLASPPTPAHLQALTGHLTIGETYFFRDKGTFDILAGNILPELARLRRSGERRLRIWSAACCTGEEPYSLAILLHRAIPDLPDWQVTILATDINVKFLQKAAAGSYGEWSFREAPAWLKERYFHRIEGGRYAVLPEIKKMVTFANVNLVEDAYPSLTTDTNAMDIIFCRNVLMYFTPAQSLKVALNLRRSLVADGWLAVSPSEGSQVLGGAFVAVNFPGVIFYRKKETAIEAIPHGVPLLKEAEKLIPSKPEDPSPRPAMFFAKAPPSELPEAALSLAQSFYEQGRYVEVSETLLASLNSSTSPEPQMFSLLTRALANQGRLAEALTWCGRWVAADKLDPSGHYLRAVVLQELGDEEEAQHSLQRVLYLQPDFVLAHFALANLARNDGRSSEAEKYFSIALNLLRSKPADDLLQESDGLTAARLTEIISSFLEMEATP